MSLIPDYMFDKVTDITPEFLAGLSVRALLIDIDNTLAPYETAEPDENIMAWFASLERAGIKSALMSNNHSQRVSLFNKKLNLPSYPECGKPSIKFYNAAAEKLGVMNCECAVIGDQLFTDVWAARRMRARAALVVPPIKDKKNLFFKFKRALEIPFIKAYRRREKRSV